MAALSVRCGSCHNVINVPNQLLKRLLEVKKFNCPHCKEGQQINSEVLSALLQQQTVEQLIATHELPHHSSLLGNSRGAHSEAYGNGITDTEVDYSFTIQQGDILQRRYNFHDRMDPRDDETNDSDEEEEHEAGEIFADYRPSKLHFGKPHPDPVVETASLAAVEPPDVTYQLHIQDLVTEGKLSGLQLESIVYACQRHEQMLPGGIRCGFFIGDGAGVGKGRTIAGLILENWRCGRQRHLWISIGSDLRVDARRDMDDVGAQGIEIHALNKLQYGRLDGEKLNVQEGVVFLSYSSLISGCDNGATRIDQLTEWCGQDFDGLVVFDECHKAKNLVPESGAKPTKVGRLVLELQQLLPNARVVYCSATGASEPRNMGYMERLGLWGKDHSAFPVFADFLDVIGNRGVGALEMVAMDMKARGMYVCRTLSFAGAEFEVVESALEEPVKSQYSAAAKMWNQLRREFLYAIEQAAQADEEAPKRGNMLWRFFWAAQQRFFRHMCMAAKVPGLVRMTQTAIANNKCVVIGLQSTGEARTQDVVAERGEELDDFVSGPKELLVKLVEDHYPLQANPDERPPPSKAGTNGKPPTGPKGGKRRRQAAGAITGAAQSAVGESFEAGPAAGKGRKRAKQKGSKAERAEQARADFGSEEANGLTPSSSNGEALNEEDEHWDRRFGSGPAGTSQYHSPLHATEEGRHRLAELRAAYNAAVKRKAQVKQCMANLDLPHNPLDMLIDQLGGPDRVAEMTGRKGRLVRMKRDEGVEDTGEKLGVKWEARNASGVGTGATLEMINVYERSLFLDGVKLVAVISEAASAGISLHADKRAKNQKRRVHLTLELPWSADKAIQQFGRSHRANQAHGPQYRLLFTPLGGERRFASAVARRLESLGALTQGDRKAGPSLSAFNYESVWGQRALKRFYRVVLGDEVNPIKVPACEPDSRGHPGAFMEAKFFGKARAQLLGVGIIRPTEDAVHVNLYMSQENGAPIGVGKIADPDKTDVGRFLNRMLGLEPEWQAYLFDFFQAMLEHTVAEAKREGKYNDGIVDLKANSVTMKGPPRVIRTDSPTGAPTLLYTVETDRGVSWSEACQMLQQSHARGGSSPGQPVVVDLEPSNSTAGSRGAAPIGGGAFFRSINRLPGINKHAVLLAMPIEASGRSERTYSLVRPNTGRQQRPVPHDLFVSRYQRANDLVARQLWEEAHAESNRQHGTGNRLRQLHLISGLVLPIWTDIEKCLHRQVKASERRLSVMRLETTAPQQKRLVGVLIPEHAVQELLDRLGVDDQPSRTWFNEVIDLGD